LNSNISIPKREHTLLICDDENELLDLYGAMLSADYKIVKASSGHECIQIYSELKDKTNYKDVILIDFKLGDIMGDELARKIREIGNAKIILISAYDIDQNLIKSLKDEGMIVEFLLKPIRIVTLRKTIANVISSS
jgi:CheY-like chemotaxis protein